MSAGELEHEWAGTPGKLIRERYRWRLGGRAGVVTQGCQGAALLGPGGQVQACQRVGSAC
jgi:hypothetical protein